MTNHPEQQQINQYIKWLVYSAPKTTALVPCTTYAWADWLLWGTVDTIVAKYGESKYWIVKLPIRHIEIVGRGRLVFMVPREDNVRGRLWDRIFALDGPWISNREEYWDMVEVLDRATTRKDFA